MRRASMSLLVVAFVVLSVLADRGAARLRVVTGTVVQFQAGEWMSVANETTDPMGFQIALRETTAYEGQEHGPAFDPAAIRPGVRVTVWYGSVGGRRPVADSVRVLKDAATH